MKATGIVRRIDELGRVVIPKEIRRTLRIKEGDPLEIFTERDELMLKKYSLITTLDNFAEGIAKSLNEMSGHLSVVCDTDVILCAYGENKKSVTNKDLSTKLVDILRDRKSYIASKKEGETIVPLNDNSIEFSAQIIVPIVAGGDCLGGVIMLSTKEGVSFGSNEIKMCQLTANILANQFEI